jgi:squalene cyclase
MRPHGGVLGAPAWAKFWMAVLGVYEYEGMQPLTPELWILPRWLPFHPWSCVLWGAAAAVGGGERSACR